VHSHCETPQLVLDLLGCRMARSIVTKSVFALLVVAALMGTTGAADAQALPAGLVGPDKKIYTKVFVFVGDAASPPLPIQDVRVLLVSATSDTVTMITDAAGASMDFLPRGPYRLVTLDWVSAGGRNYKWSMPITVAPGMGDIVLDETNAEGEANPIVAESPGELGLLNQAVAAKPPVRAVAPYPYGARRIFTDSAGLPWEVFEEHFLQSAVAHRDLPLPDEKAVLLFNNDAETRQLTHFPPNWRSLSDAELATWLAKATRIRP